MVGNGYQNQICPICNLGIVFVNFRQIAEMKILLLFFIFLNCLMFNAQKAFDLYNSHWYLSSTSWNAEEFKVTSQEVFQTTSKIGTIDSTGNVYYKLNTSMAFVLEGKPQKQFFVRQDSVTHNLYIRSFQNEEKEYLLYDFNLNEGDTVKSILCNQLEGHLIVQKVIQEGDGSKIIQAKLNGKQDSKTFKFYEGIGSTNGFIVNLSTDLKNGSILKCCHYTNTLVYSQGDDCGPEPKMKPRPVRKK